MDKNHYVYGYNGHEITNTNGDGSGNGGIIAWKKEIKSNGDDLGYKYGCGYGDGGIYYREDVVNIIYYA